VKGKLDSIIVDAVMTVAETANGKTLVDEEDVMIKKQKGSSMDDVELIRGVVIDKVRVNDGMPKKIPKAKVAMVALPLEVTKTQVKAKIRITSTDQVNAFSEQEREVLKKLADAIINSGASVLLCQKGISDIAQFYLAKAGVLAIEDIPEKDMKYAARALHATIVNKPESLLAKDLGVADLVEEDTEGKVTRISGCRNPRAITILLRGTSDYLLDELERAVVDGPAWSWMPWKTVPTCRWRSSRDRAPHEDPGLCIDCRPDGSRSPSRPMQQHMSPFPVPSQKTPVSMRSTNWSSSRMSTRRAGRTQAECVRGKDRRLCLPRASSNRSGPSASPSRALPNCHHAHPRR